MLHFIFRDGFGEGRFALSSNYVCIWQIKPDTIIINHQVELSGTRVKYLDHEKRAYKHELWSYRISEKSLIIAHYGMSRETRCLKVVRSPLQLAYFVYARSESPGEVMRMYACSYEQSAHADVIRTIISCADQSFIADHYFLIQYYNLNS